MASADYIRDATHSGCASYLSIGENDRVRGAIFAGRSSEQRPDVCIKLQDQLSTDSISVDDPNCSKYEVEQIRGHRDGPIRVTGIDIWIRCQNHHDNMVPLVGVISRGSDFGRAKINHHREHLK